ncbi:MAG TPA: circadian clock protein KaiC [Vicinamibacteria bacterium]|jgi:circadian clock protein KaiC
MTEVPKLSTGVPGFDTLADGGIPAGRSTLVVGRAGTGKTIFGLQVAAHLAGQGLNTVVLAVEESPADLVTSGDTLSFGLSRLVAEKRLRISDATRPLDGPTMVSGEYDLSGLLHRVEGLVGQLGARAVVLDSVTALFSPRPPETLLRALFFQLVHGFRKMDLTAIMLAEGAGEHGPLTTLGIEDYVCDMVIVLRNVVDNERRRRTIEVNKYRRSSHYKGEYPCAITSRGLSIFPLGAREQPEPAGTVERYSSGFSALDSMIDGGLLRDSIVIVRGPTGSGKTILAGAYARAGALRGERVSYWGFEEPRAVLLRNFETLDMGMEELEASGLLKITCRYPEAMGFEDLLVQLRDRLEEFEPSLIVLDSISSIEHSLSEKGFRQFMIGLASLLREHRRSALLTQTVTGGHEAHQTAPYLSTIADAILVLDYSFDDFELKRTLRILKIRGSAHETHAARMYLGRGGPRIEPEAVKGVRPVDERPERRGSELKGLRVLLVEDYDGARDAAALVLRRDGADVVTAENAFQALEAARRERFDVVVCDIGLPDEDGYGLVRRLRTLPGDVARTPVIALTGWTLPEDEERSGAEGFQGHLRKPIEPTRLREAVREAARGRGQPPAAAGA